jgi:predicted Zn-dependent protease
MGRYEEALAMNAKAGALLNRPMDLNLATARIYARMGKRKEARQILETFRTERPDRLQHGLLAAVYTALGDKDEAFRLLFKRTEEAREGLAYMAVDPPLESLHSDPRWQVLLRRMNFPQSARQSAVSH